MTRQDGNTAWGMHWTHREDPVFAVNSGRMVDYPNGDRLPSIMVTEPIIDDEGIRNGRTYVMAYPYWDHAFPFPGHDDEDGEDALYYGGCYYDEGMSYISPDDHDKRVDCFRAAEVFYRHAAARGNAVASMCLGYVYSYDRCEGRYWRDSMEDESEGDGGRPYPREERAYECFAVAAEADIAEACYKLGDMCKHGVGCAPDAAEAFRWYVRAAELSAHEPPVILGSAALRLAGCYEEGLGCGQDFGRALDWYKKAAAALEFAVENGEAWYEKALAAARAGEKRCLQETGW